MLRDYLAGWFDAKSVLMVVRKEDKFYPVIRVTSDSEVIVRLFEQEYGGTVRVNNGRWLWEGSRRDVIEKITTAMKSLSLLKGGQVGLMLKLLNQTGSEAGITASKIKDLNEVKQAAVQ